MDVTLEVLKWVAIVFAAGIVGQLGKSLTLKILAARRRRQEAEGTPRPGGAAASSAELGGAIVGTAVGKRDLKLRKKELKAEAKLRKKAREPD